jgi:Asp-tRNA(Asn)/Glu-tRNA(Gln) amidotransferase A subunit family amidase
MDFRRESIRELAESVRAGKITARELVDVALARIEEVDERVNAFVVVDADAARAAAEHLDLRVAAGDDVGELAGIPLAVKDTEDAIGYPTTVGSVAWADAPPATADSLLVARLKEAGAVVVGKTNTPELAFKAETDNAIFGATRNPWNLDHTPGGSSGGSAAAVAAGMVPLATGSDGGGSIRIPAAVCGLPGFKPSLGRVPAGGPKSPSWHHLSSKGVLARTTSDTALAYDAVIGPDPSDLRSLPMPEPSWMGATDDPHLPMRVAWSPTLGYAKVDPEVAAVCGAAIARLADAGTEVTEVETVFGEDPGLAWYTLTAGYNLRTIGHLRGTELWAKVDPGLRAQVEFGEGLSALDAVKAEDACHELNLRLVELFHDVRLLITPTVAGPIPRVGGKAEPTWVGFTYPFNMTRSPAGTVCAGFTDAGLPVGLQLVGPQHGDLVVLRAMAATEASFGLDPVAPI